MTPPRFLPLPGIFPLVQAARLPLTGDEHPLRREAGRWLVRANAAALVFGLLFFGAWEILSRRRPAEPVRREVRIVRYTELGVPPSIARPSAPQINVAAEVAPPSIGVPEPVPALEATTTTIATQTEMSEALPAISVSDLGGTGGDTLVVQLDARQPEHPSPEEFIPVEEEPVRIRIDPPVYPELAKQAGVEGTVMVRALVSKEGKVLKVIVVEGPEMLREAAAVCARTAVFRPALMQNSPVEVWVMMPVTFKMQ